VLDWSAWDVQNDPRTEAITAPGSGGDSTGGFAKAVEMCNNNGHCRKFDAGTMCPSYRATRDEEHVTRGRANTLRLALSGQLGSDAFSGDAVRAALDLCVSCKGCKRECPTGVDMARMKIEFLAHYIRRHGQPLKDRLIARLPDYAHAVSRVAWLANLRNWIPGAALLGERLLGLSAKRKLPTWRSDTFWRVRDANDFASAGATLAAARAGAKAAVLFVDTFNGVFESENALAAARVLKAAGYTLHTLDKGRGHHCCGPHLPGQRPRRRGARSRRRAHRRAVAVRRGRHRHRRPRAVVPADAARRGAGARPRRQGDRGLEARAAVRGVHRARGEGRPLRRRLHADRVADAGARPLPPEGVRRGDADPRRAAIGAGRQAGADRDLVLRHERQLRLRGEPPRGLDGDGRGEPAAGDPQRARRDRRRRRHELSPADRARCEARGAARRSRPRALPAGAAASP
jgi:ferredoxin